MKTITCGIFFSVLVLFGSSCDSVYESNTNKYPATFEPLAHQQLEQKTEEYHQLNNFVICSKLDEFGFALGKGCFGPKNRSNINLTENEAIEMAKQALVKNREYTNVGDPEKLRLSDTSHRTYPTSQQWKIEFDNQVFQGREVHDTSINVWLNGNGVYRIGEHWYSGIIIPENFAVSRQEALEAAIGYEIRYSDWTGPKLLVIDKQMLPKSETLQISILPYQSDDRLQLRVVWEFPLAGSTPFAKLYVDAMEGNVLNHTQLIMF